MIKYLGKYLVPGILLFLFCTSCKEQKTADSNPIFFPSNTLNYIGTPDSSTDRSSLAFSDQGAWFAYGFPTDATKYRGFTGPFLMTQENGVWSSKALSNLELIDRENDKAVDWDDFIVQQTCYNSHLTQSLTNQNLEITQSLFFSSSHSALIITFITNLSNQEIKFSPSWHGTTFLDGLDLKLKDNTIHLNSNKSDALGIIQVLGDNIIKTIVSDQSYNIELETFELKKDETKQLIMAHSFMFPEIDHEDEQLRLKEATENVNKYLDFRIQEKQTQLEKLYHNLDSTWSDSIYKNLVAKTVLTLQNNWRSPAGELNYSGLFPSYHYKWFHGFWAWDSWKHAVAIAQYDPQLAKEQIKAMYDFQREDGFIPDCIFRDTTIERHNYRNTKPPLSAWAVWKVYEKSQDTNFLFVLYPKAVLQHDWWYTYRDHDKDEICEYGCTDGSLIAAKWESGMDNAVRFDNSKILWNSENAYSLDQESVDLNAYLYTEKRYLSQIAEVLGKNEEAKTIEQQAQTLKTKIQDQFYNEEKGWFYDTSIDGESFIDVMGCEGWIPLWAEVATKKQSEQVKNSMMNPEYFNTKVPFQTLGASHPDFRPDGGYWRGPNWLDQSYFGVKGLHNYGYHSESYEATYKLIHNAEGVLDKGISIRENYQPITGDGLESENFSWSAAHYLLLLTQ